MNKLHPASRHLEDGRAAYCGPVALSAVTGCSVDAIHLGLRRLYPERWGGREHIKSTRTSHLLAVLRCLGYSCHSRTGDACTLSQWLADYDRSKTYIIAFNDHWVALRRDFMFDTHHPTGIDLSATGRWGRRVVESWIEVDNVNHLS